MVHRRRKGVGLGVRPTLVTMLVLLLVATACSGSDDDPDKPEEAASSSPAEPAVPLQARVGKVTGKVKPKARKKAVASVGATVDRWFEAAWVGGEFPRTSVKGSWPGFTKELTRSARKDRAMTTNAALARRIDGVRVVRRAVAVDLLAGPARVVGATARFRLIFDTQGERERRVLVTGHLSLSPARSRWRVFGYDVARSTRPVPARAKEQ